MLDTKTTRFRCVHTIRIWPLVVVTEIYTLTLWEDWVEEVRILLLNKVGMLVEKCPIQIGAHRTIYI